MQFKLLRGRLLLVGIHSLHQVTDLSLSVLFGLHPCPHHPKHLVVLHHHFQTIYNRSMLAFKFTTRRNTPQYPPLRILFSNLIHGNIHKAVIREYHYPPPPPSISSDFPDNSLILIYTPGWTDAL